MSGPSKAPLTPPLRLQDRQMLYTPPRSMENGPGGQGMFSMSTNDGFPPSPICAPTINILEPRKEKLHCFNSNSCQSELGSEAGALSYLGPRSRGASAATKIEGSSKQDNSSSLESLTFSLNGTRAWGTSKVPHALVRPPRPEGLLGVPGLVRPDPGSSKLHPRSASPPIIPRPPIPAMHPGRVLSASSSSSSLHKQKQAQEQIPTQNSLSPLQSDLDKALPKSYELVNNDPTQTKSQNVGSFKYTDAPGVALTMSHKTETLPKLLGGVDLKDLAGAYR
ncbi:uncharacterized protein BROUX77_002223 [Berkeleyomyces rouxiae]|uniref:uncharacterized protein n=1 Tax=Berkeleyomyces rouxiae TaxID=2035830 RepID=UPI003B7670CA